MTISVLSPWGPSNHIFVNLGVVGWSPNQPTLPVFVNPDGTDNRIGWSQGVTIGIVPSSGRHLIAKSGFATGTQPNYQEAATINPIWAAAQDPTQPLGSEISIYWEITFDKLTGSSLTGMGACDITALRNYDQLASSGRGGIIYKPLDGSVWINGSIAPPSDPHSQFYPNYLPPAANGDTMGIQINCGQGSLTAAFAGAGGTIAGFGGGGFGSSLGPTCPATAVVPVVLLDSASFDQVQMTANFGSGEYDSNGNLLVSGPDTFLGLPNPSGNGFYAGWPAFNILPPPVRFPKAN